MKDRKYQGRFTLQFNMEDPQQMRAAEVLEQQGRRKAQFLTAAILQYIRHPDGPEQNTSAIGIDPDVLKTMVRTILREDPQLSAFGREKQAATSDPELPPEGGEMLSVSDSVLAAMSNTLVAFQGK